MRKPSTPIPTWQSERAKRLQRACQSLRTAIAAGKPVGRAIRQKARSLHGRAYHCEPSRRIKLSPVTLRRWWDAWKHGGEIPAAFALKFSSRPSALTAAVAARFADFCTRKFYRSLRTAWLKFAAQPGAFGPGRQQKQRPAISYDMVCHKFGAANFYRLRGALKALHAAQIHLAKERLAIAASLRARLPDRPARRRAKRGNTFEI